jgi:hypothetical protein
MRFSPSPFIAPEGSSGIEGGIGAGEVAGAEAGGTAGGIAVGSDAGTCANVDTLKANAIISAEH